MWRKGNPHTLLVGMQIGAATLENSMEYLITFKMELHLELLLEPTDSTSGNLSEKKTRNTNSKEYKHSSVHCSIIYNHQDMEAA